MEPSSSTSIRTKKFGAQQCLANRARLGPRLRTLKSTYQVSPLPDWAERQAKPLNVGVNPGCVGAMKSGSALTLSVNTELTNLQGFCETLANAGFYKNPGRVKFSRASPRD